MTCTCQFCGKYDPSFTDEKLDMHYWQNCPMLQSCHECGQVRARGPQPRVCSVATRTSFRRYSGVFIFARYVAATRMHSWYTFTIPYFKARLLVSNLHASVLILGAPVNSTS